MCYNETNKDCNKELGGAYEKNDTYFLSHHRRLVWRIACGMCAVRALRGDISVFGFGTNPRPEIFGLDRAFIVALCSLDGDCQYCVLGQFEQRQEGKADRHFGSP
jgi:hypothetical protein